MTTQTQQPKFDKIEFLKKMSANIDARVERMREELKQKEAEARKERLNSEGYSELSDRP